MSGLKNTAKRGWNLGMGRGYKTNEERREKARGKSPSARIRCSPMRPSQTRRRSAESSAGSLPSAKALDRRR